MPLCPGVLSLGPQSIHCEGSLEDPVQYIEAKRRRRGTGDCERVLMAAAAARATGSSSNVEFIRARSDEREYRRVVLANALEVLVISDPDTDKVSPRLRPPPFACSSAPLPRSAAIARNARGPKAYGSSCLRD